MRSGSGYVTTPATRREARAAGTFGDSATTAARLVQAVRSTAGLTAAQIMASADIAREKAAYEAKRKAAAAAKIAAEEARIAAVCLKEKPSMIPHFFTDHGITPTPGHDWVCKNGEWIWSMTPAEKAQFIEVEKRLDEAPYGRPGSADITEITTTPPKVPAHGEICPHGSRYSPKGFDKCVTGYHEVWEGWFPTRNRYCDCDKAPPEEEGNGEGEGFFGIDLDKITGGGVASIVLFVVGGAIVVALLGMFKK